MKQTIRASYNKITWPSRGKKQASYNQSLNGFINNIATTHMQLHTYTVHPGLRLGGEGGGLPPLFQDKHASEKKGRNKSRPNRTLHHRAQRKESRQTVSKAVRSHLFVGVGSGLAHITCLHDHCFHNIPVPGRSVFFNWHELWEHAEPGVSTVIEELTSQPVYSVQSVMGRS